MNVMDNEDTNGSEPAESNTSSVGTRTPPGCARCRNHNVNIGLKGHKRYCKYRYCMCRKCTETLARQRKMAKKTRQQRARKQDEHRKLTGRLPEEVDPSPSDVEDTPEPVEKKRKNDNLEILLQYSLKEMYHFRIAWPLMSLVTTIVKYGQEYASEADIAEAISRISREIHEIRMMIQHGACCYFPLSPNAVGAPTYEGQVPCIGIGTSQSPFHLWPITWPLNPLTAAAAISTPPYPDSSPESSATYH
ncbi:uncharacterized protein LOC105192483 isoform X2 [Harpegnathos saltator]|uniref:uncharacterized protein LOC105192483 isoform X2 n=1 Tax=Harpegnathos saltator TaxID=610380 RepID=UPI00059021EE|nr:uncharacterized protein LOC105192483 isoform X2 [Harpegnathos saltator]